MTTLINNPAPAFDLACTRITDPARERAVLEHYRGRWLVVMFYPHDFSLVCPTELVGLSQRFEEFQGHGCELLGISGDSVESHERWIATPRAQGGLGGLNFPLASDPDGAAARNYGVYHEGLRLAMRGLFIIDPDGIVQYQVVHNLSVGRRSQEVLRVLMALQSGGLCREDWMADDPTLDPFTMVRPGRYFSRYLIEAEVGSGTFARVFRARDLQLDRPVALKVFKPDCPVTPSAALAEARAAAALNHPNLCTIYAVDDTAGVPIITMEYIAGRPIGQLARGEGLASEALHSIARQMASGMAAAHAAGIVHGDLKPENVLLADDGLVKILDFGLARRLRRGPPAVSDETAELGLAELGNGLFGTPRYLAPEQVRGEPASPASDLFSLGVIFFELATGKTAFPGPNLLQVLDQIRSVEPEAMAADVPEPFAALVRALLVPDPARRSITMREVAEVLIGPSEQSAPLLVDLPPIVVLAGGLARPSPTEIEIPPTMTEDMTLPTHSDAYLAIFDHDGVLVDSLEPHQQAWFEMGRRTGLAFTPEFIHATFGMTNPSIFRRLLGDALSDEEIRRYSDLKEECYRDVARGRIRLMDGVREVLDALTARGVRLAIGSSGVLPNLELTVNECGLPGRFAAIASLEDITRGKPDPQVFLVAAAKAGVDPSRSVVFEDAPVGIQAARAAGMYAVGVTTTVPAVDLLEAGADEVVANLVGYNVARLMEHLEARAMGRG